MADQNRKQSDQWQASRSLVECNDFMFTHQVACDVHFHLRHPDHPAEDVSAHKYILISRSPVFYAMLCGEMSTDHIEIVDIEPSTFKIALKYLYTDLVDLNAEKVFGLMYVAKKYMIETLVSCCSKFLSEVVNAENACLILNQSILFDVKDLQASAIKFIEENTEDVLDSEEFSNLTYAALSLIVKSDDLSIEELGLINAVFRWVDLQCTRKQLSLTMHNKRNVIGGILKELRFHTLSPDDFSVYVSKSGILINDDIARVYMQMFPPKCEPAKADVKTKRKGTQAGWVDLYKPSVRSENGQITMVCDKDIEIFGLKVPVCQHEFIQVDITIESAGSCRKISYQFNELSKNIQNDSYVLNLPEPVKISLGKFSIAVNYTGFYSFGYLTQFAFETKKNC